MICPCRYCERNLRPGGRTCYSCANATSRLRRMTDDQRDMVEQRATITLERIRIVRERVAA